MSSPNLTTIDARADAFDQAWRAGRRPDARAFLADLDEASRCHLLVECLLIAMEYEVRAGRPFDLSAAVAPHAELAADRQALARLREGYDALRSAGPDAAPPPGPAARSPAPAARPDEQRETIGRYRAQWLCTSGQSVVYTAVHPTLRKPVVIKLARRGAANPMTDPEAFHREAQRLAKLNHPHVARVYDLDVDGGRPYLVLEHVSGRTLRQFVDDASPPPRVCARLLAEAARAVHAAHLHGIVHCDLKPGNIMVDDDGRAMVIDFGLCRLRDAWSEDEPSGFVSGTLPFMSPEQAAGGVVTARSDVYALGAVLYWLLVGRPPFADDTASANVARVAAGAFDAAALRRAAAPRALKRICADAMAARPQDRVGTADEMADRLERFARGPSRRALLTTAVAGAAAFVGLGAVLRVTSMGTAAVPNPAPVPPPPPPPPRPCELTLTVWRAGNKLNLLGAVPLRPGDGVRAEARVGAGLHAALFAIDADGLLHATLPVPRSDEERVVLWPSDPGQAHRVAAGRSGTQAFVLCTSATGPVSVDDVRAAWSSPAALAGLARDTVIEVTAKGVFVVQQGRQFDGMVAVQDPELMVRQRLERFRQSAHGRFAEIYGIAVPFDGSPADDVVDAPRP